MHKSAAMFLDNAKIAGQPVRGVLTVVGAFIMELMLGAFYTFGKGELHFLHAA